MAECKKKEEIGDAYCSDLTPTPNGEREAKGILRYLLETGYAPKQRVVKNCVGFEVNTPPR